MHYYKINNEIMQYSTFGNDIALIMHYRALFTMSASYLRVRDTRFDTFNLQLKL